MLNVDHYIGNDGIKNVMTRQKFQEILQNLHLAKNKHNDKSNKINALYVRIVNIHNIMSLKRTPVLVKISYEKNLHFRFTSVNIFQTRHMMT